MSPSPVADAAKVRQEQPRFDAYLSLDGLLRRVPLDDRAAVRTALLTWASRWWPTYSLDAGGVDDVALHVQRWAGMEPWGEHGRSIPAPVETLTDIAIPLLANVANGRAATDYDYLRTMTEGIVSERTARRYRQRFGYRQADGGISQDGKSAWQALTETLGQFQRRQALAHLVSGGRSLAAARQWLLRHPGEDWRGARPPQARQTTSRRSGSNRVAPGTPGPILTRST